jgi:hypothetical protein
MTNSDCDNNELNYIEDSKSKRQKPSSIALYNLFLLNNYIRQFIFLHLIVISCGYRYIIHTYILKDFDKYILIKIFNSFILLRPWFGRTCVW